MSMIELHHVSKWYGEFQVLQDISLQVGKGERVVVCGPSGSGKSTMIRCINRLEEHDEGQILVDGTELTADMKHVDRIRRDVGMVFQQFNLFPHLTILQNLTLAPMRIRKMSKTEAEELAMHFLNRVRIPEQAHKYPRQLSGGQQQRVAIARALCMQPKIMLFDEPTASLDVSIQAQIITLLEQLQRDFGLTYLFISHDLGLVRYFCDRIVVMYLGRIVEVLPHPEAAPRHPYTRALLDSTFAPDPTQRRNVTRISGEIPSAYNLPPGCAFAARCPSASDLCRRERPELSSTTGDPHTVACHHPLT
jgi:oligopeptide/dipeptide ABC transporter ATP-binding protein